MGHTATPQAGLSHVFRTVAPHGKRRRIATLLHTAGQHKGEKGGNSDQDTHTTDLSEIVHPNTDL